MAADKTADASTGVSTPLSQGLVAAIYGAGSGALTETGVNRLRQTLQRSEATSGATDEARPAKHGEVIGEGGRAHVVRQDRGSWKVAAKAAKGKSSATAARSA